MLAFLQLPLEVRSMIIEFAIQARSEHTTEASGVWYKAYSKTYVTSAYGLLGVNKQLNRETTMILAKLPTVYEIHIGLIQGRMLWPTWMYLPRKTKIVDILNVTFQARGPGEPCCKHWRRRGGVPSFLWWSLYTILESFIEFGVQESPIVPKPCRKLIYRGNGEATQYPKETRHFTQVLDLNCIEPDDSFADRDPNNEFAALSEHSTQPPRLCKHCKRDCKKERFGPKNYSAVTMYNWLNSWIHMFLNSVVYWGEPLFWSIGKIRFRVNGILKSEIDLTELLLKLPDRWEDSDISTWKKQAIQFREAQGVRIPNDVQQQDISNLRRQMQLSEDNARQPSEH